MSEEVWRPVVGYEGWYEVSNIGRVRRCGGRVLTNLQGSRGYELVNLSVRGKTRLWLVHRLVAMAFVPNPCGFDVVNHLDENKTNNRANNLEWTTLAENFNYGTARMRSGIGVSKYWASHKHPREKSIRCVETGDVYRGIHDASRKLKITPSNISMCLHGHRNTAGGYHWEFAE